MSVKETYRMKELCRRGHANLDDLFQLNKFLREHEVDPKDMSDDAKFQRALQIMNPGVYPSMERAQYEALSPYNQTALKKWMELGDVPSEFKYWQEHRHEEKESESFRLGRALDCYRLEPYEFSKRFIVVPDDAPKKPTEIQIKAKKPSPETVKAIDYWENFKRTAEGKTALSVKEFRSIYMMSRSLGKCDSTKDVFERCKKVVLVADLFGFPCKGEVDLWDNGRSDHIWDLKALKDVSSKGFSKAFFDFGYDVQATFYLSLARALKFNKQVFNFICVKNSPPYTVQVHSFSPFDNREHQIIFDQSYSQIGTAMREVDEKIKANDFEDDKDWRMIDVPAWRLRQVA